MDTPEERLVDAVHRIVNAGGVVLAVEPLAAPGTPTVLAGHRINVGASTSDAIPAVTEVMADITISSVGLIPLEVEESA